MGNDAWKDKYEPEESKTVQRGDGALRIDLAHRFEPGQDVATGEKQPRDITQHEMQVEDDFRRHLRSPSELTVPECLLDYCRTLWLQRIFGRGAPLLKAPLATARSRHVI